MSEAGAGSDVASVKTFARKDGDDYVIRGEKMWITNGTQADWMCCLANTSEGAAHRNKSLIIVPLDAQGVDRTTKLHKLGMWSSDTAQIFFDDVRVPQRYRIGEEGEGFVYQMQQFQEERLFSASSSLPPMEECITRPPVRGSAGAFGRSILDNQVVHYRLAELDRGRGAARSDLSRHRALRRRQGRHPARLDGEAQGGPVAARVADSCLQYWGGQGYVGVAAGAPLSRRPVVLDRRRRRRDHAAHPLQARPALPAGDFGSGVSRRPRSTHRAHRQPGRDRRASARRALGHRWCGNSAPPMPALNLDEVDEAVAIGPAAAACVIDRSVIDAARRTGAGAIHPGYGFLSENASFADACTAAGLVWVGPPAVVLRLMGDKAAAKAAMAAAGVPCVPGVDGRGLSDAGSGARPAELGMPLPIRRRPGAAAVACVESIDEVLRRR